MAKRCLDVKSFGRRQVKLVDQTLSLDQGDRSDCVVGERQEIPKFGRCGRTTIEQTRFAVAEPKAKMQRFGHLLLLESMGVELERLRVLGDGADDLLRDA